MNEMKKQYLGRLIDQPDSIFIQKNDIKCKIKALNASDDEDCKDQEIWVVQSDLVDAGFVDHSDLSDVARKEALKAYLKDKLFTFNLYESGNMFVAHETLRFIKIHDSYDYYEGFPVANVFNRLRFNQRLLTGKRVHIDGLLHLNPDSEVIDVIVHASTTDVEHEVSYHYSGLVVDQIFPDSSSVRFKQVTDDNQATIRRINLDPSKTGCLFNADHSLLFIPDYFKSTNLIINSAKATASLEASDDKFKMVCSDNQLLKQFKNVIQTDKYRLVLDDDDLLNLHTSIKSNLLTVLAGISGTGKSRIVKAYADALGIGQDSDQFKFIAVRPFWQDDSDLLGFVDNMSHNYYPGDVGLVETLQKAKSDSDNIYLIVLDEMNLARVEHYFSQFLSVLERDPNDRYINLYDPELAGQLNNANRYPDRILVPENVRFIGTMNVDDSTFEFSDKLLDRANVIHLKQQAFINRNRNMEFKSFSALSHSKGFRTFKYKLYKYNNGFRLSDDALNMLWALNEAINDVNPNLGVSWRTVSSIESFIRALPEDTLDVGPEFDRQLASRIFTKLRGTSNMLSKMFDKDDNQLQGSIIKVFDNYANLSDYSISRQILLNKVKELEINGFAR